MRVDPVVASIAAAALAVVFIVAAVRKGRDIASFEQAVIAYALLPERAVAAFARAMALAELAAGLALLPESTRTWGAALSAVLLAVTTMAVVANLLRSRTDIDCGCGGEGQPLSWALVARNAILLAAAAIAALPTLDRPLAWLDAATVAFGTLALLGLLAAANQMLSNRPRLAALRRR